MRPIVLLVLVGLSACCSTTGNPTPTEVLRQKVRELVISRPVHVAAFLGVHERTPGVEVAFDLGLQPNTVAATNEERDTIAVRPIVSSLPDGVIEWFVIHELVHVHMAGSHWMTLPDWLEEGVAEYITRALLPGLEPIISEHRTQPYADALAYVDRHGFDTIRILARMAYDGGETTISNLPPDTARVTMAAHDHFDD